MHHHPNLSIALLLLCGICLTAVVVPAATGAPAAGTAHADSGGAEGGAAVGAGDAAWPAPVPVGIEACAGAFTANVAWPADDAGAEVTGGDVFVDLRVRADESHEHWAAYLWLIGLQGEQWEAPVASVATTAAGRYRLTARFLDDDYEAAELSVTLDAAADTYAGTLSLTPHAGEAPQVIALELGRTYLAEDLPSAQHYDCKLSFGGPEVGIGLCLAEHAGDWYGMVDLPHVNGMDFPLVDVAVVDDEVSFTLRTPGGRETFVGAFEADSAVLSGVLAGTWHVGEVEGACTATPVDTPVFARESWPLAPYPYVVEDVAIENEAAGVTLSGTLTRPRGAGPFPAAILISGSGPTSRDASLLGHKFFLGLADYLTRRGVAVFRYDDRGVYRSTGEFRTATTDDFANDAAAIYGALAARPEIDGTRTGFIGHSEGGLIGPMAIAQCDAAFMVGLAGPAVAGHLILEEQTYALARAEGLPAVYAQRQREQNRGLYDLILDGASDMDVRDYLEELARVQMGVEVNGPEVQQMLDEQVAGVCTPWMRRFLALDPTPYLEALAEPVLWLFGDKDLQVLAWQSRSPVLAALGAAQNEDITVRTLAGMNHLFQTAGTGSFSEYAGLHESYNVGMMALVSDWIVSRFGND